MDSKTVVVPDHVLSFEEIEALYKLSGKSPVLFARDIETAVLQKVSAAPAATAKDEGLYEQLFRLNTWPDDLHDDTKRLVFGFASALACKLASAERKYGYSNGWTDKGWMDECRQKLIEHLAKGDPRDVANYCAFLWWHNEKTPEAPVPIPAMQSLALGVVKANHQWHLDNDDYDGYPESELCEKNLKAIAALSAASIPQPDTAERDAAPTSKANSLAGFHAGFLSVHGRAPTEQEIWNAGVRSGIDRTAPQDAQPDQKSDSLRMSEAGYARRPTRRSLPSDEEDAQERELQTAVKALQFYADGLTDDGSVAKVALWAITTAQPADKPEDGNQRTDIPPQPPCSNDYVADGCERFPEEE
jgi:hypothetical protein